MEFDFSKHARFMGRVRNVNSDTPSFNWSNSAVFLTVDADEIVFHVDGSKNNGNSYVEVVIDNIPRFPLHMEPGVNDYPIKLGKRAPHTLEIQKKSEALSGSITLRGFSLPNGGEFLAPPPAKKITLEYYGDSITCGAGDARDHDEPMRPDDTDAYRSYVGVSARLLNANYHTLSISGCGVIQDAFGLPHTIPPLLHDDKEHWDLEEHRVDGVVINLGTNDFSSHADTEKYEAEYLRFLHELCEVYHDPYIFCCVGTMTDSYLPHVSNVVRQMREDGNLKVHLVNLGLILPEVESFGGMFHPGLQTHYRMGVDLANHIGFVTGWKQLQRPSNMAVMDLIP